MSNRQYITNSCIAYPTKTLIPILSAPVGKQLLVHSVAAYNATLAAMDMAIMIQYKAVDNSYLDNALAAVSSFPANMFTTNGDSFYVGSKKQFNSFAFNITQSAGGAAVMQAKYWNGSSYILIPGILVTSTLAATGEAAVIFNKPLDWVSQNGVYYIKLTAVSGIAATVIITNPIISQVLAFRNINSKEALQIVFLKDLEFLLEAQEAVGVYFSTADNKNSVEFTYRINP